MARVRGANTGYAVSLVIFGFGFVVALLFAIIFYTKIEAAEAEAVKSKAELDKIARSSEMSKYGDYAADGNTVVGGLVKERDAKDAEIKELTTKLLQKQTDLDSLQESYTSVDAENKKLAITLALQKKQSSQAIKQVADQVDPFIAQTKSHAGDYKTLAEKVDKELATAKEVASLRIAELTKEIDALKAEKESLSGKVDVLAKQNKELIDAMPKVLPKNTTLPDGKVASVIGESGDLFISLGRKNGLVMGMTFEVYEPASIIRLTDLGVARGKATVEVYELKKDIATCRVVRLSRGESVKQGDAIVNLAYDPNMDISIYPYGYFDIERDLGDNDLGRIKAMIAQGGAEIPELTKDENGIPVLTPDLDFVVLGTKPEFPEEPKDTLDPAKIQDYQARLAEYKAYFRILDEAKLLRIPVLNQNRFLELMGYYVR